MRPARSWRVAAAVLLMALMAAVAAPNITPAVGESRREAPKLKWRSCSGGECAELPVPLDYAQPEGEQIEVALFRVRALDRSRRIGSLLMNPGGPGASGVEFVRQAALALPLRVRQRFDLVGFDPRGTGDTIPVNCRANLDRHFALDLSPDDAEERAVLARRMNRLALDCERHNREILPHISTVDTVRDMDRVRAALGDDKLTFVGFSYGTYMGALYADLFPERVRALVLDGAVDPELDKLDTNLQQAAGFEASLGAFLEWCSARRRCAFHNDGDSAAAYDRLSADIDARPLAVGERRLGPGEFDLGVVSALYSGEFAY
jgi:pimeloyl-ACP methyl ester carboxylesterase